MAKKKSRKRRPPARRPAAASSRTAARTEPDEAERPASKRAERKEDARRERERRIKAARRRQRNRKLVRWGVAGVVVLGVAGFAWMQSRQGEQLRAEATAAADRLGCTEAEQTEDLGNAHTPPFVQGTGGVPATSGSHSTPLPADPKTYDQPIPEANAVHNLEHGYVVVYYSQDGDNALPEESASVLEDLVSGETEVLLAPYEGLSGSLALTAWRTLQTCSFPEAPDDGDLETVVAAFIEEWKNSGRAPEAEAA